jgi:hypothetical protein
MSRGLWAPLAMFVVFACGGQAMAQAAPPVIVAKAAIGQPSGLFDISVSGTFTLVNGAATGLETHVDVRWRKADNTFVTDPAVGIGPADKTTGNFSGTKAGSNPPDTTAVPQVRVSIWGVATPGAGKTRLTPFTAWETMPRQN